MKKTLYIPGAFLLFMSAVSQAGLHIMPIVDEQVLREKTAFALGVTPERIMLEQSDRIAEPNRYFFNVRYQKDVFQCYVATLQSMFMSDVVCRPTDGSDLPR